MSTSVDMADNSLAKQTFNHRPVLGTSRCSRNLLYFKTSKSFQVTTIFKYFI